MAILNETALEATYPCPVTHIEYKAVLLAHRWDTYGLEMWAHLFLTGNISSQTHTQNMNSIYLQDKKDVHMC